MWGQKIKKKKLKETGVKIQRNIDPKKIRDVLGMHQ